MHLPLPGFYQAVSNQEKARNLATLKSGNCSSGAAMESMTTKARESVE